MARHEEIYHTCDKCGSQMSPNEVVRITATRNDIGRTTSMELCVSCFSKLKKESV